MEIIKPACGIKLPQDLKTTLKFMQTETNGVIKTEKKDTLLIFEVELRISTV
jgi:hypothetical protein